MVDIGVTDAIGAEPELATRDAPRAEPEDADAVTGIGAAAETPPEETEDTVTEGAETGVFGREEADVTGGEAEAPEVAIAGDSV